MSNRKAYAILTDENDLYGPMTDGDFISWAEFQVDKLFSICPNASERTRHQFISNAARDEGISIQRRGWEVIERMSLVVA